MGDVFARGRRLYVKIKVGKKWKQVPTPFNVGDEAKARAWKRKVRDGVEARADIEPGGGPVSLRAYAKKWIDERAAGAGPEDVRNNRAHLKNWILPAFGGKEIADVTPRDLSLLVRELRAAGLASRTVRNVYGTACALFRDAMVEGLIGRDMTPAILGRGHLPPVEDKRPGWRATAAFSRSELARLLYDEAIPFDRRVLYALLSIAFLRHGEAAGLTFADLRSDLLSEDPVPGIMVDKSYSRPWTKTRRVRRVPIVPALGALLAEWQLSGWAAIMNRPPSLADLVVPHSKTTAGPAGRMRTARASWARFQADLELLGMRPRRVHDLRRTGISLARADGAEKFVLKRATHGQDGDVMELYTGVEWEVLCREVCKLNVPRFTPGEVRELNSGAASTSGTRNPAESPAPSMVQGEGARGRSRTLLGRAGAR